MTITELLGRLDSVRACGGNRYSARCPAHDDRSPSLSIKEGERGLLIKCWAGCTLKEITMAIGCRIADLFFAKSIGPYNAGTQKQIPPQAMSFRFELEALDRRLRAERTLRAIAYMSIAERPDTDLDLLIDAACSAYADMDQAKLLEAMADDIRLKELSQCERIDQHAA